MKKNEALMPEENEKMTSKRNIVKIDCLTNEQYFCNHINEIN